MKLIAAFFRLIRWPNLVFIALTQLLFFYCVIVPSLPESYQLQSSKLTTSILFLLVIASVLIAAAGYIINDYFDINIDQVNKPEKVVVQKIISRRWAILLHMMLTLAGLALSVYISIKTSFIIIGANIICALLLWVYSTTFKKKLLAGNIIISGLTAWTVLVLYFAVNTNLSLTRGVPLEMASGMHRIYKFAALYAGFAFIISLIREVIKDIEDMDGDARYNCKTMPIVWGVPASKVFVGVWIVVLVGALGVVQFYMMQLGWWLGAVYVLILVVAPLALILKKIYLARTSAEYHKISTMIKLVMLTGICSIVLIRIYS